jgi:hypothetical protein
MIWKIENITFNFKKLLTCAIKDNIQNGQQDIISRNQSKPTG